MHILLGLMIINLGNNDRFQIDFVDRYKNTSQSMYISS